MIKPKFDLEEALIAWEDYDETLSPEENLIELQVQMGFLDEANSILADLRNPS